MSWAEIKKAINSNISKSLDVLITEKADKINSCIGNNEFGLYALKSLINSNSDLLNDYPNGLPGLKSDLNSIIHFIEKSLTFSTDKMVSLFDDPTYMRDYVQSETKVLALLANNTLFNIALNSSTAMNAIASSSTAMDLVAKNNDRMKYIASSDTALDAITSNSVAMNSICASESALKIIIGNEKSLKRIVSSGKAITAMASSSLARNIILSSDSALNALANSPLKKTLNVHGIQDVTISGSGFIISFNGSSGLTRSYDSSTNRYTWATAGLWLHIIGNKTFGHDAATTSLGGSDYTGVDPINEFTISGGNLFYENGFRAVTSKNTIGPGYNASSSITINYVPAG